MRFKASSLRRVMVGTDHGRVRVEGRYIDDFGPALGNPAPTTSPAAPVAGQVGRPGPADLIDRQPKATLGQVLPRERRRSRAKPST